MSIEEVQFNAVFIEIKTSDLEMFLKYNWILVSQM